MKFKLLENQKKKKANAKIYLKLYFRALVFVDDGVIGSHKSQRHFQGSFFCISFY